MKQTATTGRKRYLAGKSRPPKTDFLLKERFLPLRLDPESFTHQAAIRTEQPSGHDRHRSIEFLPPFGPEAPTSVTLPTECGDLQVHGRVNGLLWEQKC